MVSCSKSVLQALCIFLLLRASTFCDHQTKASFVLKFVIGGCEHKVALDDGGLRAYCIGVQRELKLSILLYVQCCDVCMHLICGLCIGGFTYYSKQYFA